MKCASDGVLRAYADEELATMEAQNLEEHLRSCTSCSVRLQGFTSGAQQVSAWLAAMGPDASEPPSDPALAYSSFRQRFGGRLNGSTTWTSRLLAICRRPVWGGLAAVGLLALLLSFAPARSWGQKFLQMLRVEKLAVVPVDLSAFSGESVDHSRGKLIAQLISDSVVVTMKPGEPARVPNLAEARQQSGFNVRTLDELGAPQRILVGGEGAFHMTLDRDRMQAVLDNAGRSDIQLPASVDGATVAVHVPKSVRLLYGNCSRSDTPPALPNPAGAAPEADGGACIDFMQVPTPVVSVPPGLNVNALAEAGLQITGMTAAEAHAYCQTVDWSSTLVVPVPRNGSSFETMSVDGVKGTFVHLPARGDFADRYALIWVKNGLLYSLTGKGSAAQALSAVQSLN